MKPIVLMKFSLAVDQQSEDIARSAQVQGYDLDGICGLCGAIVPLDRLALAQVCPFS
jgi:hypothetical protein